jgi:hypothetical protein
MTTFRISTDILGPVWTPIFITTDRLFTLGMALVPELLENWLDATANGKILQGFESKELLLVNIEPLICLTTKKTEFSISPENEMPQSNIKVGFESTTHM